ncbi:response regulator transcription factor [Lutibaculum baratangense]|uniref:Transcriptional regulator, LuxR family n=1 Tax=Lutibaculum baratangense AMV1 TaxID=631454 RepID=V4RTL9_9HYPH|nr:response regulator transcription factor [Lutibaculum baratangense]ESR26425.1 Transcriptional regulator, LuxR family [Lutibaculum baratangense AMV1]
MAEADHYRILIADDHPLFRDALRNALTVLWPGVEIAEAGSLDELAARIEAWREVDLVLLDLAMPGVRGFSGLLFLRAQFPEVPVIVVSAHDEPNVVRRSLEFGALGFIPKSAGMGTIRQAVETVMQGRTWTPPDFAGAEAPPPTSSLSARLATLTPQQVRVLMMLSDGLLNKQIAHQLNVSEATVKAHVSAILQKLGVDSRTQAVIAASRIETSGWIDEAAG